MSLFSQDDLESCRSVHSTFQPSEVARVRMHSSGEIRGIGQTLCGTVTYPCACEPCSNARSTNGTRYLFVASTSGRIRGSRVDIWRNRGQDYGDIGIFTVSPSGVPGPTFADSQRVTELADDEPTNDTSGREAHSPGLLPPTAQDTADSQQQQPTAAAGSKAPSAAPTGGIGTNLQPSSGVATSSAPPSTVASAVSQTQTMESGNETTLAVRSGPPAI
ncbi:hypothetical protein I316_07406 [Kwoniella heveanensis BCC8398]|uniref:Uncharacterized protein n=1 Tax=Kwoniella heveanensis BCC8398 TaxID=1296120 RepID=A0A1B9GIY3_9TREE|nr:hypothetical protein I316_07406 [Kwoniella heveanensis BCC8398]